MFVPCWTISHGPYKVSSEVIGEDIITSYGLGDKI